MNPEYPFQPTQPPAPQPQPTTPGQFAVPGSAPNPGYSQLPPANFPPVTKKVHPARKWVIMSFVFIFTTLAVGGFAGWSFAQYLDYKDNSDTKVDVAVATAVKVQADKDAAAFLEKEKQPNRQFVGPDDYGRLAFDYPKSWSVYEAKSATTGGTYEAYFNPSIVPTVVSSQQFSLHVTIEDKDYDKVVDSYKSLVSKGDLVASSVKANGEDGQRLDGSFTKDIRGSAVIIKIRDKTVTIRSDAETFKTDFDALIQTITFNK
jgi:hypothetical protein